MAATKFNTKAPSTAEKNEAGEIITPARSYDAEYDFGDNVEEAIEKFGSELVFDGFVAKSVVEAQAKIRQMLEDGKSEQDITDFLTNVWKPGLKLPRASVDPKAAFAKYLAALSPEDRLKAIEDMQAELASK